MAKNLDPKCKQCRRIGEKLFLKGERCFGNKCVIIKRNFPPGMHGSKSHTRLTDYGIHLKEKQKLKKIYDVLEKQLRNYFKKAIRSRVGTGLKLIELLERRLDNVIYRLGLANSRSQAKQFVSHSLFLVNHRKTDIPSYLVKPGDIITIRKDKTKNKGNLSENIKNVKNKKNCPSWLNWDAEKKEGKVVNLPEGKDLEVGVNTKLVTEYYSR